MCPDPQADCELGLVPGDRGLEQDRAGKVIMNLTVRIIKIILEDLANFDATLGRKTRKQIDQLLLSRFWLDDFSLD